MAELIWSDPALSDLDAIADYRQIVETSCRSFYRYDGTRIFILHLMRCEPRFRKTKILTRNRRKRKV